jgi:alpha-tubulin suppressor-like RCC1 family protein
VDGNVYAWGAGGARLGLGDVLGAQIVPNKIASLSGVTRLACGSNFSAAIDG